MSRTLKVSVTAGHIVCGAPSECEDCAVSLALWDAGVYEPTVHEDAVQGSLVIEGVFGGQRFRVPAPPSVVAFVDAFDSGEPSAGPFEFDLEIPEDAHGR